MTTMQTVTASGSIKLYASETAGLQDGKLYRIRRLSPLGHWLPEEYARFSASNGRSLYFGKWRVVDRKTPVYHDEKVKVMRRVSK